MNNETTDLCRLAYKYGVDKCPRLKHNYTPFYYELLKDKRKLIKKVLEIGIGYASTMRHVEKIKGYYKNGSSLYMWRDFLPNAEIYSADIRPELIFSDTRITTFLCDQTNENQLHDLIQKTGNDIDFFVDDGSHDWRDQVLTCKTLLKLLKKDVIYVIEDVRHPEFVLNELRGYECREPNFIRKYRNDRLILVKNK